MNKRLVILSFILFLFSFSLITSANSLWSNQFLNIYQDYQREYEQGDVITVIIEETANAVQSANTSTSQDSKVSAGPGLGILDFFRSFSLNYSDADNADGQTQRSGALKADITTQIIEIQGNGNLKIAGSKSIKINGEEQIINLTGIIRADDITLDNTVSSTKVAEASIEYEGKGDIAAKQRPGILSRLFNWLF